MKTHLIVIALNIIFDMVYAGFVTVAAMHFEKPYILMWYLLLLFTGYHIKSYQKTSKGEGDHHEH